MTEESFDKDKILSRVRKMMNLAHDKAAAEGERENALRMAHNLLAKYNLSLAEAEMLAILLQGCFTQSTPAVY